MSDTNSLPLFSIGIPAYNLPDYTRRTIRSIIEQRYRPLELILSDDHSPNSLETLLYEFQQDCSETLSIRFFRQTQNLGPADNMQFVFEQATGKYYILMPHDDWFVDPDFILKAVTLMEQESSCYLCVGNSQIEGTNKLMAQFTNHLVPPSRIRVVHASDRIHQRRT